MRELLIDDKKVCCVCGGQQTRNRRTIKPDEPSIVSLYLLVYRRGNGPGQMKKAPRVYVCEDCLKSEAGGDPNRRRINLWHELRFALLVTYKDLLEADEAPVKEITADEAYLQEIGEASA